MTTEHLEAEMLKLPRDARMHLAELLISSLDDDSDFGKDWVEEAESRLKALRNGEGSITSSEEVLTAIRREYDL